MDVLVPVRAPSPWLGEALQSVVEQDYPCGLIVVMDGFSDEVRTACARLDDQLTVTLTEVPAQSGIVAALNHGLQLSDADYIARLDADDRCRPERLARQVDYMTSHPTCAVLGTGLIVIDGEGAALSDPTHGSPRSVIPTLRWRTPLAHPSVMLRRQAVVDVGGYCARALHVEDFDLWLRLAASGVDIDVLPEALLDYRRHPGQVTARSHFSSEASRQILRSRLEAARGRGESALAARCRHLAWLAHHRLKGR